jgi:hypothetical protein
MTSKDDTLLSTTTGEPYQPARVYYQVFNPKTVISAFKKLRCMDFDPNQNRWLWLYEAEAKKIRFERSYNKIPKDIRPIAIGYFVFRGQDEMHLELRSLARVTKAIQFFDKRINRRAAQVTKVRIVNKMFSVPENRDNFVPPSCAEFFDRDDIYIPNPRELDAALEKIVTETPEEEGRLAALTTYMEEKSKQPLPEIEEIPANIYETGLLALEMALTMRQIEAFQHWQGNTSFSQYDLLQKMMGSISERENEAWEDEEESMDEPPSNDD